MSPTINDARNTHPTAGRLDRRQHLRTSAHLGCKVLRPALARFFAAETADVSKGGVSLIIDTTRPLTEGEELEIGVNWQNRALLTRRDLVHARVVRADPLLGTRQRVAVAFSRLQPQADAVHHAADAVAA